MYSNEPSAICRVTNGGTFPHSNQPRGANKPAERYYTEEREREGDYLKWDFASPLIFNMLSLSINRIYSAQICNYSN